MIPFLGAGFSASLGLPSWEDMLRNVCAISDNALPFDEIMTSTGGDLLQVAEYLYLQHDRQIGPIRHQIEKSFAHRAKPALSGPHIELVNLAAGQIYTTNYDDIIEQTYRDLALPVTPVILPKDVALANPDRTQVVKYHGDLAHERTLVLTESAYYKRLDFESPMDLKFRSDLLGKSVLFIGYSFRDINIRIIWFKLMDMMRDVPEADRRPSYIVRFESNPALEELYAAVGLRTIVLNPDGPPADDERRSQLLGEFLLHLSVGADAAVPRGRSAEHSTFVSAALLDMMDRFREEVGEGDIRPRTRYRGHFGPGEVYLHRLLKGVVPNELQARWEQTLGSIFRSFAVSEDMIDALERIQDETVVGEIVFDILAAVGQEEVRAAKRRLLTLDLPWHQVWERTLTTSDALLIMEALAREIRYQSEEAADSDIIWLVDLVNRIAVGAIPVQDQKDAEVPSDFIRDHASKLVDLAGRIYPAARTLTVTEGAPDVADLEQQVSEREKNFRPVRVDDTELHFYSALLASLHHPSPRTGASSARRKPAAR